MYRNLSRLRFKAVQSGKITVQRFDMTKSASHIRLSDNTYHAWFNKTVILCKKNMPTEKAIWCGLMKFNI